MMARAGMEVVRTGSLCFSATLLHARESALECTENGAAYPDFGPALLQFTWTHHALPVVLTNSRRHNRAERLSDIRGVGGVTGASAGNLEERGSANTQLCGHHATHVTDTAEVCGVADVGVGRVGCRRWLVPCVEERSGRRRRSRLVVVCGATRAAVCSLGRPRGSLPCTPRTRAHTAPLTSDNALDFSTARGLGWSEPRQNRSSHSQSWSKALWTLFSACFVRSLTSVLTSCAPAMTFASILSVRVLPAIVVRGGGEVSGNVKVGTVVTWKISSEAVSRLPYDGGGGLVVLSGDGGDDDEIGSAPDRQRDSAQPIAGGSSAGWPSLAPAGWPVCRGRGAVSKRGYVSF